MLKNLEYIQSFIEEAKNHVETIENILVNMNLDAINPDEVNTIFRAVHSMKGSAGFFNLSNIVELSHCMESLFGEVRNGKLVFDGEMIDVLLLANDCLKAMADDVLNSEAMDIANHVDNITRYLNAGSSPHLQEPAGNTTPSWPGRFASPNLLEANKELIVDAIRHGHMFYMIKAGLNEDLLSKDINPVQLIQIINSIGKFAGLESYLSEIDDNGDESAQDLIMEFYFTTVLQVNFLNEVIDIPEQNIFDLTAAFAMESDSQEQIEEASGSLTNDQAAGDSPESDKTPDLAGPKSKSPAVEDSIRVHVSLLNDLLNLASEMVLGRNQLLRAMEKHRKSIAGIDPVLQNIDHITTELQEKVMQTRMQPISIVFSKFPRIIKDLGKKLGKEIELKLEGTDVELDKSIIESIGDPLTHLIRNAADHGLETPEERERLGKPRTGHILMKAYHEGGYVNIDVIDDGTGINIDKIKNKALENGIIHSSDISIMGEQEILQLMFKPGFSTSDAVTDVSGRGVGLDVVKTNIEKLGGTIEIFTTLNKGTTFRLLLPLTLAIIPSLIVKVADQRFALPQANLQEIVRIKPGQAARRIEYINNAEVLRLRGGLLPIVHLADVLGLSRTNENSPGSELLAGGSPDGAGEAKLRLRSLGNILRILVIKIGSRKLGIAVDAIHGSEEILVKPLSSFIKDCKCYSGVTIMGDGKTAMILDPEGIIAKANLRFNEGNTEKVDTSLDDEIKNISEQQDLLLFKCSGPERLAIDLSMVSRVEEIAPEEIQKIGDKEYIKFRQDSLRVIRPEDFLPIGRQTSSNSLLYVVIPKLVTHPMGIIIEQIHDTIRQRVCLNRDNITVKGLIGSTIINDRITLLINVYDLFEIADPDNYKTEKIGGSSQATILVVEDTPFFQELEKNYLTEAGYKVLVANHGRQALQILQETPVDAVVSDIQMPVMDGIELVKRIRADQRLAHLPVLAVTSLTGDGQMKKGLDAGFDMYEFKLDKIRLLKIVREMLEKRRIC